MRLILKYIYQIHNLADQYAACLSGVINLLMQRAHRFQIDS